jgi:hypothetical protein
MIERIAEYVSTWQLGAALDLIMKGQPVEVQLGLLRQLTDIIYPWLGLSVQASFQPIIRYLANAHLYHDLGVLFVEIDDFQHRIDQRKDDYTWAQAVHGRAVLNLVLNRVREFSAEHNPSLSLAHSTDTLSQHYQVQELQTALLKITLDYQPHFYRLHKQSQRIMIWARPEIAFVQIDISGVCHHLLYLFALAQKKSDQKLLQETIEHLQGDSQALIARLKIIETYGVVLSEMLDHGREQADAYFPIIDQIKLAAQKVSEAL